jgi:hypothetical protein
MKGGLHGKESSEGREEKSSKEALKFLRPLKGARRAPFFMYGL